MAEPVEHRVHPTDERRHPPGPELLWNESYYLDFVDAAGDVGGYVRIGLYPNLGVTWWTTMVVGESLPVTESVSYDLPPIAGPGLVIEGHGYQVTGSVEDPLKVMAIRGTAPAIGYEGPAAIYRGESGRPTSVALDLEWITDGVPYHYELTTRYEVPCLVRGEITLDGERVAIDGQGQRDHSWGERDWWAFGWCWAAARLDDGTRLHFADIRIPGMPIAFGYVQPPGGAVHPVEALAMTEVIGEEGLPERATATVEPGGLAVAIRPIAFGPLVLVAPDGRTSRFPRAMARFVTGDGRSGTGWIEWNQPQPHNSRGVASGVRLTLDPSTDAADYRFVHQVRTRFSETDAMGVIHHGAYAAFLEEARVAMLRQACHPYGEVRESGIEFAVLELYVRYRRPLYFDEPVDINMAVANLSRTTFEIGYLLQVEGDTRCTAVTVHGAVAPDGRPSRMPAWFAGLVDVTPPVS